MNQFALHRESSGELKPFPHIMEFALTKINNIQLDSFPVTVSECLQIYYVIDGKFDWTINRRQQLIYPGEIVVAFPGQEIGGSSGFLGIGTLFKLFLHMDGWEKKNGLKSSEWSKITEVERMTIGRILKINDISVLKTKDAGNILSEMRSEVLQQEIGYLTRVNYLIDSLIIVIARQSTRQANSRRDFPRTFSNLEQTLRQSLSHQWSVEEMAAIVGLGTTAFTEKVKAFTGFSPLNYLINIRISEAIKLLKRADVNVTTIALETGFYSSQHFSTTFKKLTGYTPGDFRKRNISNAQ